MLHAEGLGVAAAKLARIAVTRPGARVVVTCDLDDAAPHVAARVAQAVRSEGGQVQLLALDRSVVASALASTRMAIEASDTWLDLATCLILDTPLYSEADHRKHHVLLVCGADEDLLVRGVAQQDLEGFSRFIATLQGLLSAGTEVHLEDDRGSDFRFAVGPQPIGGSFWQFPGQANFSFADGTAEGRLVVNGVVFPPASLDPVKHPLTIDFRGGRLVGVAGEQAGAFSAWLERTIAPERWVPFHFSFGFNPGIPKLRGNMLEDERVWGAINVGIGRYDDGWHTDTVLLGASVSAGSRPLLTRGQYVHPDLVGIFGNASAGGPSVR